MATIIASGGTLTATAGTVVENTASIRYIRITCHNPGATTRNVIVTFGAQVLYQVELVQNETRTLGPHALTAAETVKAYQAVGADVLYRITGES